MEQTSDRHLLRRLRGELSAAESKEVDRRVEASPALAERVRRLRDTWDSLAGPDPRKAPPGFARDVLHRLEVSPPGWPVAMRWAATAVVVFGVVAGTALGQWVIDAEGELPLPDSHSFAESYVELLDEQPNDGSEVEP